MHENRETSEMSEAIRCDRPAGEGNSRTARVYVFEESDLVVVCAEQRVDREGSSPSGASMRRPVFVKYN